MTDTIRPDPARRHRGRPRPRARRHRRRHRRATRWPLTPSPSRTSRTPFQVPGSATNVPSGVVSPTTVEEVQAIVRIANEHRVPLWPISRGKNNGYGGAAPQVRGTRDAVVPGHEPGPRDQRGARLRHRRARRELVRPARRHRGGRPRPRRLHRRHRLGRRRLEHARARPHLHAVQHRPGLALRLRGRPARRRPAAHRLRRAWTTTRPGRCTSAASGRRPPSCSCSPTTASSRRWATG